MATDESHFVWPTLNARVAVQRCRTSVHATKNRWISERHEDVRNLEGVVMKYYFLALGLLLFVCVGCSGIDPRAPFDEVHHAPPAAMLQRPGPMVDGPGPGVIPVMAQMGMGGGPALASRSTQVKFAGPTGMMIGWKAGAGYADGQLMAPGRYDFGQGSVYQLKLTGIPERDGLVLYPTLEVRPSTLKTDTYLSLSSVPLEITDEDLDQVQANNFVTKVIYLPDARYQELAVAGVETLVSTRLDPGVDPVAEADRRGTIMAILRMGNKDLEMPMQGANGQVIQTSHKNFNGTMGQYAAPVAIGASLGEGSMGIPGNVIAAGSGMPGQPAPPIAGMGPTPVWGQPMTGTPIGLPGPPHLPYGGPASLKSHTVRNLTHNRLPEPVDHLLFDVKHDPPLSLPEPVRHVKYTERHPTFHHGEVNYPAGMVPAIR